MVHTVLLLLLPADSSCFISPSETAFKPMRDEKFYRVSSCVETRRLLRRTELLSAHDVRVKRRVRRSPSETGMELISGPTGTFPVRCCVVDLPTDQQLSGP